MIGFPQVRCVTTNDYIEEINNAIDSHNYLSALVLSLMLPDICSKYDEKTNYDETKSVSIRINVVIFAETMINGYRDFLSYIGKDNIKLFNMIDWDKVGGKIVFTSNK